MTLRMTVFNVEHGSAIYIATPNHRNIVIDLGGTSDFSPLLSLSSYLNVRRIDRLIVTHPHLDHIEDILNTDRFEISTFSRAILSDQEVMSGNEQASVLTKRKIQKYIDMTKQYAYPVDDANDHSNPLNWGGVNIKIYHPVVCDASNINNRSVVTLLEYLGVKILIPGDNEEDSWKELLDYHNGFDKAIKNTNILIAAHHGRESGYYGELFKHFSPFLTVVSDGKYLDTSATSRYSAVSEGWKVYKRSGGSEVRKCLTTRNDGLITVDVGRNVDGGTYLKVEKD